MIHLCQHGSQGERDHSDWVGDFIFNKEYSLGNYLEIKVIDIFEKVETGQTAPDGTKFYCGRIPIDVIFSAHSEILHDSLVFGLSGNSKDLMALIPGKHYSLTAEVRSCKEINRSWYAPKAKMLSCTLSH